METALYKVRFDLHMCLYLTYIVNDIDVIVVLYIYIISSLTVLVYWIKIEGNYNMYIGGDSTSCESKINICKKVVNKIAQEGTLVEQTQE